MCEADNCTRAAARRGLCDRHYMRATRAGKRHGVWDTIKQPRDDTHPVFYVNEKPWRTCTYCLRGYPIEAFPKARSGRNVNGVRYFSHCALCASARVAEYTRNLTTTQIRDKRGRENARRRTANKSGDKKYAQWISARNRQHVPVAPVLEWVKHGQHLHGIAEFAHLAGVNERIIRKLREQQACDVTTADRIALAADRIDELRALEPEHGIDGWSRYGRYCGDNAHGNRLGCGTCWHRHFGLGYCGACYKAERYEAETGRRRVTRRERATIQKSTD